MRVAPRLIICLAALSFLLSTGQTVLAAGSLPTVDNPTWKYGDWPVDLAAVALDQDSMPAGFTPYGEFHRDIAGAARYWNGQLTLGEILATGFIGEYSSYFNDGNDTIIKVDAMLFRNGASVAGGFALFQDENLFYPNSELKDAPALPAIGSAPGEVTLGYLENGDGTRTYVNSATFRVGPLLLTVEMQTPSSESLSMGTVRDLAVKQSDRAQSVLDGADIPNVVSGLGSLMVWPTDAPFAYDGYTGADENYLLRTMDTVPDGIQGAYEITFPLVDRADTFYPLYDGTVASFDSANALDDAFQNPETLMYSGFPDLAQINDLSIDHADNVAGFTYSLSDVGSGARLFLQSGNLLLIADVEGASDSDTALAVATAWAQAAINCVTNNGCQQPTGLPGIPDPSSE